MAHLSLYRKFRPSRFEELVRQEHVVRILKNQIERGEAGHAYLFTGPRGTGKTTVARIFARAVNCEHPVNGSPCGTCATCRALEGGSLDLSEIDAASNNGVNEMRDLREKVQYPPVTGRYKVYIIDEVHMLTDSAFNALLKTLEEPPAHVIFILATTEPQKIPATILSRCMRLDFKLIPTEDLEAHLKRLLHEIGREYEDAAVSAIARAGAGSDRDMLSVAEMCLAYSDKLTYEGVNAVLGSADFRETGALLSAMLTGNAGEALERAENVLSSGRSVGVLCRDILTMLNQIAVCKLCKDGEKRLSLPRELYEEIASIAGRAEGRALLRATELFASLETELRYSTSPRISLETAVMRAALPAAELDLDALMTRVAALEAQLKAGVPAAQPVPTSQPVPPAPAAERAPAQKAKQPAQEDGFDGWIPPEEEPVFAEAYFDEQPAPMPQRAAPMPKNEARQAEKPAPVAKREAPMSGNEAPMSTPDAAKQVAPAADMTAEVAFGKFMRTLRRTSLNGVLFTMCSDLETHFEGGALIFETDSEAVFRSLNRAEHKQIMGEVLATLGIADFAVRKKQEKRDGGDGLDELKRDFPDYPLEIK